jgi:hypothetical protein
VVLRLHYGCEHITIEEADALRVQFAKGKTELETKDDVGIWAFEF